jgi:hypothetical protein
MPMDLSDYRRIEVFTPVGGLHFSNRYSMAINWFRSSLSVKEFQAKSSEEVPTFIDGAAQKLIKEVV